MQQRLRHWKKRVSPKNRRELPRNRLRQQNKLVWQQKHAPQSRLVLPQNSRQKLPPLPKERSRAEVSLQNSSRKQFQDLRWIFPTR